MKNCRATMFLGLLCIVGIALAGPALATQGGDLPQLTSYPADPFTPTEEQAVTTWMLAQPAVKALLGDDRTRILRGGSDYPKGPDGPFRRATLIIRNYDQGLTHEVTANLATGEISTRNDYGLIQPNRAEREEAIALIEQDESLAVYRNNPKLVLNGAFFLRSPHKQDPCSRNICLIFHFVDTSGTHSRSARRVLVDLTRGEVVPNRFDYGSIWDTQYVKNFNAEGK
ncbi:MAG: hypothetical protein AAF481_01315 [Acidobacteriota bacterium]